MNSTLRHNLPCKLIVVGPSDVGKSALIRRFVDDEFDEEPACTVGVQATAKSLVWQDASVKLTLWDVGQDPSDSDGARARDRAMTAPFYKNCSGVVLVYDVTNPSSFEEIKSWRQEAEQFVGEGVSMLLVGNKSDLGKKRRVRTADGEELAQCWGVRFFEVSARTSHCVDDAFITAVDQIRRHSRIENLRAQRRIHATLANPLRSMSVNDDRRGTAPHGALRERLRSRITSHVKSFTDRRFMRCLAGLSEDVSRHKTM